MFIDESQSVKNHLSQRAQSVFAIKPRQRYLISGTIATADVAPDIYAQLKWMIGCDLMFPYPQRRPFEQEFTSYGDADTRQRAMTKFYGLLDPYQIRRNADDAGVSSEIALPPIEERRLTIEMSGKETDNYEAISHDLEEWLKQHGEGASELDMFSKMWALRRATTVPWVDNPEITQSSKLDVLRKEVASLVKMGRKILIGSEMLPAVDAITAMIPYSLKIDGTVDIRESDRRISLFQEACPDCNVELQIVKPHKGECQSCGKKFDIPDAIVASRNSVREGVNLNKASVVIVTDPSWTYSALWQFYSRARRGICHYDKLTVLYMEADNSIDVRMYDTAEHRKQHIIQSINRQEVERAEKVDMRAFLAGLLNSNVATKNVRPQI